MSDLLIPHSEKSNTFYVYVFQIVNTPYFKIGYTNHLRKRLAGVNTSSPFDVECIAYYRFDTEDDAREFENTEHIVFEPQRLKNTLTGYYKEWFTLTQDHLDNIQRDYSIFISHKEQTDSEQKIIPINPRLEHAFAYCEKLKEYLNSCESAQSDVFSSN